MNKALKWTLILIPVAGAGYLIYRQVKKYQKSNAATQPAVSGGAATNGGCMFPISQGSIGPCVKQLQLALISKFGTSVLPKYGADSNWGPETNAAVKAATGKTIIYSQEELAATISKL